ncbi:MAG: hypothetical protein ABI807_16100, partial [Sporichthyaceae bacterium]
AGDAPTDTRPPRQVAVTTPPLVVTVREVPAELASVERAGRGEALRVRDGEGAGRAVDVVATRVVGVLSPADARCEERRRCGVEVALELGVEVEVEVGRVVADEPPSWVTDRTPPPAEPVYGSSTRLAAPNPTPTAATANTSHSATSAIRLCTGPFWLADT